MGKVDENHPWHYSNENKNYRKVPKRLKRMAKSEEEKKKERPEEKECSNPFCERGPLPVTEEYFYRRKVGKGGLANVCKECSRKRAAARKKRLKNMGKM